MGCCEMRLVWQRCFGGALAGAGRRVLVLGFFLRLFLGSIARGAEQLGLLSGVREVKQYWMGRQHLAMALSPPGPKANGKLTLNFQPNQQNPPNAGDGAGSGSKAERAGPLLLTSSASPV